MGVLVLALAGSATAVATGLGAIPVSRLGAVRRGGPRMAVGGAAAGGVLMVALATAVGV